jgi:hypothetical protein
MEHKMTEEERKKKKAEYQKKWRVLHKDEMYEAHRKDYQKHKEARISWQHQYWINNKKKRSKDEGTK